MPGTKCCIWVSFTNSKDPSTYTVLHCFPRYISRELKCKWSNWKQSNAPMWYRHCMWNLNPLCHSDGPSKFPFYQKERWNPLPHIILQKRKGGVVYAVPSIVPRAEWVLGVRTVPSTVPGAKRVSGVCQPPPFYPALHWLWKPRTELFVLKIYFFT